MLNLDFLKDYTINASGQADSRVLTMKVTGEDPVAAANLANILVYNFSVVAEEVMDIESVNIIDEAKTPENRSGPNRPKNVITGFILGDLVSMSYFVLRLILNRKISLFNRVEVCAKLSIIAKIPTTEFKF